MDKLIIQLVDELPNENIAVEVLKALDYVAPLQWNNLVVLEESTREITEKNRPKVIQQIRDRAVSLYHDPEQGYQTAIKPYQTIDKADTAIAIAALANKVVHSLGYGLSYDAWLGEDNIRIREHGVSHDNGYTVSQKFKVWDQDNQDSYSGSSEKIQDQQYYVHYLDSDSSDYEWVDAEEIR